MDKGPQTKVLALSLALALPLSAHATRRVAPPAATPVVSLPFNTAPLALSAAAPSGYGLHLVSPAQTPVLPMPTATALQAPATPNILKTVATPQPAAVAARALVPTASLNPAAGYRAPQNVALPAAAVPGMSLANPSARPSAAGLEPILRPDGQAGRAPSSLTAQAAQIAGRLAADSNIPGGLDASFQKLEHLFDGARDEASEGNSVVPNSERRLLAGKIRTRFNAQITAMENVAPEDKALLDQIRKEGTLLIDEIESLMAKGEIDPRADIRTSREDMPATVQNRELRVGFYAVAADPFQWAHLLIGLRAMAAFRLDKIVFVLAGDDPRKPNMTPAFFRHPMGRAVLDTFAPLFKFSAIAHGTTFDGETNIFRFLGQNQNQRMRAFYIVGGDHYRLKDKNGGDDTLPKLEKKLQNSSAGHNPDLHAIEAVFIARDGMDEHVPSSLPVHFLPTMSFEASSTLVRNGQLALMPYAAYEFVKQRRPGLYGIGTPKQ